MKLYLPAINSKYLLKHIPNRGIWKFLHKALNLPERENSSKALLKSEASLRSIFDNMDTSYILIDTDLKIVSFNQSAYERILREKGMQLAAGAYIIHYTTGERRKKLKENYCCCIEWTKKKL